MTKKRTILAILMLLILANASAHNPDKNDGVRSQKYVYRTSEEKIQEAVRLACNDSVDISVVTDAIKSYLNKRKPVDRSHTKPNKAIDRAQKQLQQEIQQLDEQILALSTPVASEPTEPVIRLTVQEIAADTAKLKDELQQAQMCHDNIQKANQLVVLKNKYMAKYPCVVEKTLNDYLNEADSLMKGPYNAQKNKELADTLNTKFKKNKQAQDTVKLLLEEEKAYKYFLSICKDLKDYYYLGPDKLLEHLINEYNDFKVRFKDRYTVFDCAFKQLDEDFKQLTDKLEDEDLTEIKIKEEIEKKIDSILEHVIVKEKDQ